MKDLTKNLSIKETAILLVLGIVIVAAVYYLLVDSPVRKGMASVKAEQKEIQKEYEKKEKEVATISDKQAELDEIEKSGNGMAKMPSYNANREEITFMHKALSGSSDYQVDFNEVTREGDQIRRDFSIQYTIGSYKQARKILKSLEYSEIRCLIGDISVSSVDDGGNILNGPVQVRCTATFYETMYGGKEDNEIPKDKNEESE